MTCQVCGAKAMQKFTCGECGTANQTRLHKFCVCELCGQSKPDEGNTEAMEGRLETTSQWLWVPHVVASGTSLHHQS